MGKAGRIACISLPLIFTFASLICIVLIFLGGTNQGSSSLSAIYFFRADTSQVPSTPNQAEALMQKLGETEIGEDLNSELSGALSKLKMNNSGTVKLKDFYTVSLWGYCDGTITHSDNTNTSTIDFCSAPAAEYAFDPVTVWGLNNTDGAASLFPAPLNAGLATYRTVAKWMYIAYVASLIFTILELICGFLASFSRWGSLVTTIMSSISSSLILLASITATALYGSLVGTFNSVLKSYGIHGSLGHNALVITWLAVAFSWAGGLFWLFSTCCCSGRSDKPGRGRGRNSRNSDVLGQGEKGYQRVGSPYLGAGEQHHHGADAVPMHNLGPQQEYGQTTVGGGYEPYRHANV